MQGAFEMLFMNFHFPEIYPDRHNFNAFYNKILTMNQGEIHFIQYISAFSFLPSVMGQFRNLLFQT